MSTNYDRQAKLAESAPLPELQALSKGANPRLVQPFVALGALNARMAQMQSDKMLQGAAAPGSMPTLKDKIEQSIAQMKAAALARQQAAQSPGMFQVAENTPEPNAQPEAQYYDGGVARLPVRDNMFGYAGGGIIAFNGEGQSDVPEGLTREEAEAIRRRMKQRTDMTPEKMDVTDLDFTSIPGMEKSDVLAKALAAIPKERKEEPVTPAAAAAPRAPYTGPQQYTLQQQGADWVARKQAAREAERNAPPAPEMSKEELDKKRTELRAGLAALYSGAGTQGVKEPVQIAGIPSSTVSKQDTAPPKTLPDGRPNPAYQEFLRKEGSRDRGADPFAYSQEKFPMPAGGIAYTADAKPTVYTGESTPGTTKVPSTTQGAPGAGTQKIPGTTVSAPKSSAPESQNEVADFVKKLMNQAEYKAKEPESAEEIMRKQDEAVSKMPTAPEVVSMIQHLDKMAKRYEANDQAEEAQKAINARNNLATFLMGTRGSSLGIAAGKADAALQPLLAAQETRRQSYQKLRDEQELSMGKMRFELASAERARKEGRYKDALTHQQKARDAELEAAKLNEQRRGHSLTAGIGLLRDQETRRHHTEQMANIAAGREAAAQRHAENMAFREKQFGTQTDLRRQQLLQTNPMYKQISEQLEPLEMIIAGNVAAGKPVDKKMEAMASALRMRKQQIEAQFDRDAGSPAPSAPTGKVLDFRTIGQK